jgi:hypothetical protein
MSPSADGGPQGSPAGGRWARGPVQAGAGARDHGFGGRPEDIVLRLFPSPSPTRRIVDRLAGVSRRRRLVAYASIAGGITLLRPLLVRLALVILVTVALVTGLAHEA